MYGLNFFQKWHYENIPMYTEGFFAIKNKTFQSAEKLKLNKIKNFDIFLIFAQNIDCGYTLELPLGGFNEYPQSMFWEAFIMA